MRMLLFALAASGLVACGDASEGPTLEGTAPEVDGDLAPEATLQPSDGLAPEAGTAPAATLEPEATLQPDSAETDAPRQP
ncbi:MAG: hypothetical protein AAF845_04790 [Bacteroidota bacterium]